MTASVREDIVKCQSFYRCNLLQCRNVEIFLVAVEQTDQRFCDDVAEMIRQAGR